MKWYISVGTVLLAASALVAQGTINNGDTKAASLIRTARSGPWSEAATWEGGQVPAAGNVEPRPHRVVFQQ
jgi:uncharacterized protein (DUF433 family)